METTAIRLPEELVLAIERVAQRKNVTRSDVVREALERYCAESEASPQLSRMDLLRELVSYDGSGVRDLGTHSEAHLRKRFLARRRTR